MQSFLYIPSLSVGPFGIDLSRDFKIKNTLSTRFFSDDYGKWKHPYFLITAGHHYKNSDAREHFKLQQDTLVIGDSGGYQIATGSLKYTPDLLPKILSWLETNCNISINLDIPPRGTYGNKFKDCLDLSYNNFKYFSDNRVGKTKLLNVIQGRTHEEYLQWYNKVKVFEFDGWACGGGSGSVYRYMSAIMTLMQNKEQYNKNNKYIHMLGSSKIIDFLILAQLQKSLHKLNPDIQVMTDSSTPGLSVVYGIYFMTANYKAEIFNSIHIPKSNIHANLPFIKVTGFDDILSETINFGELFKGDSNACYSMVLHNLYFFIHHINILTAFTNNFDYLGNNNKIFNDDIHALMKSIDLMVTAYENNTTPLHVFEKYKELYMKYNNFTQPVDLEHNKSQFFKFE